MTSSPVDSLPIAFRDRLGMALGMDGCDRVLHSIQAPRPLAIRIQGDTVAPPELESEFSEAGLVLERVPWFESAFIVRSGTRSEIQEMESYRKGRCWIQSLSSMASVLAMGIKPGHDVLDLCAAPGSKTSLIAHCQQGRGVLVANDRSRRRIYRLRENLKNLGVQGVEITNLIGESYGGTHRDCFDRVLVDAPCSGEGMIRFEQPGTWEQWNMGRIRRLARQQERLLHAGIRTLRPGGVLVYSTCTYAPEENEGVLDRLLKRGVPVSIEPLPMELPDTRPGMASWNGVDYDPSIADCVRILPGGDMSGFFIARLRKTSA